MSGHPFLHLPRLALEGLAYRGVEALGAPYAFEVFCLGAPGPGALVGAQARWEGPGGVVQGLLAEVESLEAGRGFLLRALLRPRLWRLSLDRAGRVHAAGGRLPADLLQGLEQVWEAPDPGPDPLLVRPPGESALDALDRWCAARGLTYRFQEGRDGEAVVFMDESRPGALLEPQGLRDLSLRERPGAPSLLSGVCDPGGLGPGLGLRIRDRGRPFDGDWLLTGVVHEGVAAGHRTWRGILGEPTPDRVRFEGIPAGVRPTGIRPAGASGVEGARVPASGTHGARIERGSLEGTVTARLDFQPSVPLELPRLRPLEGEPGAGNLPLPRGTPVAVAFLGGDPGRPYLAAVTGGAAPGQPGAVRLIGASGTRVELGAGVSLGAGDARLGLDASGFTEETDGILRREIQGDLREFTWGLRLGAAGAATLATGYLHTDLALGPRLEILGPMAYQEMLTATTCLLGTDLAWAGTHDTAGSQVCYHARQGRPWDLWSVATVLGTLGALAGALLRDPSLAQLAGFMPWITAVPEYLYKIWRCFRPGLRLPGRDVALALSGRFLFAGSLDRKAEEAFLIMGDHADPLRISDVMFMTPGGLYPLDPSSFREPIPPKEAPGLALATPGFALALDPWSEGAIGRCFPPRGAGVARPCLHWASYPGMAPERGCDQIRLQACSRAGAAGATALLTVLHAKPGPQAKPEEPDFRLVMNGPDGADIALFQSSDQWQLARGSIPKSSLILWGASRGMLWIDSRAEDGQKSSMISHSGWTTFNTPGTLTVKLRPATATLAVRGLD
jgi:hypothetical protein